MLGVEPNKKCDINIWNMLETFVCGCATVAPFLLSGLIWLRSPFIGQGSIELHHVLTYVCYIRYLRFMKVVPMWLQVYCTLCSYCLNVVTHHTCTNTTIHFIPNMTVLNWSQSELCHAKTLLITKIHMDWTYSKLVSLVVSLAVWHKYNECLVKIKSQSLCFDSDLWAKHYGNYLY